MGHGGQGQRGVGLGRGDDVNRINLLDELVKIGTGMIRSQPFIKTALAFTFRKIGNEEFDPQVTQNPHMIGTPAAAADL